VSRSTSSKRRKGTPLHRQPSDGPCPTTGKRRWPTRPLARAHARRLAAQGDQEVGRLGTYRCPSCDDWHIGHR
jgi:hypothetical protein